MSMVFFTNWTNTSLITIKTIDENKFITFATKDLTFGD